MVFQEACLQGLPVMFCMDRAGIAGNDGPTHNGVFDIAYLRTLPNITLLAPRDGEEFDAMLRFMTTLKMPSAIRYPRANLPDFSAFGFPGKPVELGRGELLFDGKDGAILAYGAMVEHAIKARQILLREGLEVAVANARFAKPVDVELASSLVRNHPWVLTVEDHAAMGGFGSAVLEALSLRGEETSRIRMHAIPDHWIQHGDRDLLLKLLFLDSDGIADVVRMLAAGRTKGSLDQSRDRDVFYGR
jgi:1-deoxy-D-xylulose-5-phosphate synthase